MFYDALKIKLNRPSCPDISGDALVFISKYQMDFRPPDCVVINFEVIAEYFSWGFTPNVVNLKNLHAIKEPGGLPCSGVETGFKPVSTGVDLIWRLSQQYLILYSTSLSF